MTKQEHTLVVSYELLIGHYRIHYGCYLFNDDPELYQLTWNGCGLGIKSHDKNEIYRLAKERILKDAEQRSKKLLDELLELRQITENFII